MEGQPATEDQPATEGQPAMEGTNTENSIPWDGGGSANGKKKRGRQRVTQDSVYALLPEHAIIEKDDQSVAELQEAYRILQSIDSIKHITPFYDKPTQDKFGMSSYYSIIKKPMWLNEVRRKIECGEYEGLHDFVADLHLMLHNCYKFWGETHRISSRGAIIEHKIETKLAEIPWSIKEKMKCPVSTGDCIICDERSNDEDEDSDSIKNKFVDDPDRVYYNSKGYTSKIVLKVLNNVEEDIEPEEETEEAKEERLKMEKWEQETLNKLEGASVISHVAELVDIGLFLKLTHEVLNVEEMTQYEVERMLLIPMESSTLQTLMTSILSSEWKRNILDETPLMPYNVWNRKLRQRISSWLRIFYKYGDPTEVRRRIGVDPYFWSVVSLLNPMDTNISFHELPFYVRVWVFKTLLDNILDRHFGYILKKTKVFGYMSMRRLGTAEGNNSGTISDKHTNKTISDLFIDETRDPDHFRHAYLGKGLMNNHYKAVPAFLPEIRIYKEMSPLLSVWTCAWEDADDGAEKLQRNRMTFKSDTLSFGPNTKTFELVARDLDSLNELIGFAKFQDLQDFSSSLTEFKQKVETSHTRCGGLKSIYNQYHSYHSRNYECFTYLENLWSNYENRQEPVKQEKKEDGSETIVLGKRRTTPKKFMLDMTEGSSESGISENEQSESDISDWESTYKNHQRKKKLRPLKKKKLDVPPPAEVELEVEPVTVKKEAFLMSEFKMEPMEMRGSAPGNDLANFTQTTIKTEEGSDIAVILSSDDEEDVKPPVVKCIKLRDVSTLLKSPPHSGPSPDHNLMTNLSNNFMSNIPNNLVNNVPNNLVNNMPNNLNVVIPPMPGNSMNSRPLMGMNRPMSVQVPPNLYQVRSPRQRIQNPRQMMVRSPMRSIAPRPQMMRPTRMPVPKPITPKKPVPKPLLMSAQEWANTPPPTSPNTPPSRGRSAVGSPLRGRSPATPPQQMMWTNNVGSPRNRTPPMQQGRGVAPTRSAGMPPKKALFTPAPPVDSGQAAEGKLTLGPSESGSCYVYQIVLTDGGIRYLTDAEVAAIKRRNSGTLPRCIRIPPDGSFL